MRAIPDPTGPAPVVAIAKAREYRKTLRLRRLCECPLCIKAMLDGAPNPHNH